MQAEGIKPILDTCADAQFSLGGEIGRRLEAVTRQWILPAPYANPGMLEMFRQRYPTITPKRVSEFLLLDREFPRTVLHCISKVQESLRTITGSAEHTYSNPPEQKLGRLLADLNYANIDEITKTGLHEYIDSLQTRINQIDDAIHHTFFGLQSAESETGQSQDQTMVSI